MPPKLSKKQKKAQEFRQKQKDKALSEENAVPEVDIVADQPESKPIDEKKRKAPSDDNESNNTSERPKKKNRRPKKKGGNNGEEKKNRYILFVGNLGFNTKTEELAKHFESVGELPTVRLMTDKQTKKQKGFAFIEFKDSLQLSKALAFHHTYFNKRQINVELTAGGGGGRSEARKEKIKEKNEKLQLERQKWHKEKVVGEDPASSYQQQTQEQE